ncbi:MAG: hypothetical protein ACRENL_10255 [Candidatus Dormibacteria bacterium]
MNLTPHVENIQRQLAAAADASGPEARALAERLATPLDAAIRITLQDALVAAAEEITCDLAPGSVEVRLRGRETEFVVTPPPVAVWPGGDAEPAPGAVPPRVMPAGDAEDASVARINLRLPDQLKSRVEQAAGAEGLSANTWLVRAIAAAVDRNDRGGRPNRPGSSGSQRYTGWAR